MARRKRNPTAQQRRYWLEITEDVRRQVDRLPGRIRQRIKDLISSLADEPRPASARPMRNHMNRYRIASAKWRIVYRVDDEDVTVEVWKEGKKQGPEFYAGIQ